MMMVTTMMGTMMITTIELLSKTRLRTTMIAISGIKGGDNGRDGDVEESDSISSS